MPFSAPVALASEAMGSLCNLEQQPKILIVEDDAPSIFILKNILIKECYQVVAVARSGSEAIEYSQRHTPDLILMDIHIQGEMDGIEAAQLIHKQQETPIVYLTGQTDSEVVKRAKSTTPFGFILKPYAPKEVAITVEMALYKAAFDRHIQYAKRHLETTLGNLQDAIITTDSRGVITYLNPAAELQLGVAIKDAIGRPIGCLLKLFFEKTGEPVLDINYLLFSHSASIGSILFESASPQRGKCLFYIYISSVKGSDNEPRDYVIALHDVTLRYQAEKANHLMAAALSSIEDAVIVTDTHLGDTLPVVLYANSGFEKLTHFSASEFIGRPLQNIWKNGSDWNVRLALSDTLIHKKGTTLESVILTKNGEERISSWSLSPVFEKDSDKVTQLVFVIRDITLAKQQELYLQQSQKIEAIVRLAGGIAHDFNNLLSVINTYSDLLKRSLAVGHPLIRYAEAIHDAGKKEAQLIAQLMTFSRREALDLQVIDLRQLINNITPNLRELLGDNITLKDVFGSELDRIRADRGQIEQVITHLCLNSRDAMPNGGTVTIELNNHTLTTCNSDSSALAPGSYVCLTFSDTGIGMEPSVLRHAFDPFFTTKPIGKGTGLGLSTVYGIVKQHGGHIAVSSQPNQGTTFKIYWISYKPLFNNEPLSSRYKSVLIVQDDETITDCISGMLSLHGYVVHTAISPQEMQSRFSGKFFELIIVDIASLAIENYVPFIQELMSKNGTHRFIFLSQDPERDSLKFLPLPCSFKVLQKPFPLNLLLKAIHELFEKSVSWRGKDDALCSAEMK